MPRIKEDMEYDLDVESGTEDNMQADDGNVEEVDEEEDGDDISYHSYESFDDCFSDSNIPCLHRDVSSATEALLLDPSAEIRYKTCDYKDVFPKVKYLISRTADQLFTDTDTAQILLCNFFWDKEKLYNDYFSNSEDVRMKCGYTISHVKVKSPDTNILCPVCYDSFPIAETLSLECGHSFCLSCFEGHLCAKISDGPDCVYMKCPGFKCTTPIGLGTVEKIFCGVINNYDAGVTKEDTLDKYIKYLTTNFISMNSRMRFCPGLGCSNIAYGRCIQNNVKCGMCAELFCFKCGSEAHDPCSCEQLRQWNIKCQDDNDTYVFLQQNTRNCPNKQCKAIIQLEAINCGYMRCRACCCHFCWHCMQVTDDHVHREGKPCNKYEPTSTGKDASELARQRTVHYYGRYQTHMLALRKLRDVTLKELHAKSHTALVESLDVLLKHLNVVIPAVEQVAECRRVLMYTYILGYYLVDGTPEKDLYEYQQNLLESNTDMLGELVQKLQTDETCIEASETLKNSLKATSSFRESVFATMMGHSMALTLNS